MSDKALVSKLYRKLLKLNNKKQTSSKETGKISEQGVYTHTHTHTHIYTHTDGKQACEKINIIYHCVCVHFSCV